MSAYTRLVARFAATRAGAAMFKLLLPALDRLTFKVTKGRRVFTNHAVPTLILTTTGRKTGQPRAQPLCYLKDGADLVVVGSNWGQEHHPSWTANLLAHPRASIVVEGQTSQVEARPVEEEEWETLYRRFEQMSQNYRSYRGWARERKIRMFRLTPVRGG
ncbi:MAG TPA: nitroreductase/quinone reductase family protein [Actinomycetota bacterium]|nr:nitroreductase/quinone reductase family protein [Actinomycetota bacterium]